MVQLGFFAVHAFKKPRVFAKPFAFQQGPLRNGWPTQNNPTITRDLDHNNDLQWSCLHRCMLPCSLIAGSYNPTWPRDFDYLGWAVGPNLNFILLLSIERRLNNILSYAACLCCTSVHTCTHKVVRVLCCLNMLMLATLKDVSLQLQHWIYDVWNDFYCFKRHLVNSHSLSFFSKFSLISNLGCINYFILCYGKSF